MLRVIFQRIRSGTFWRVYEIMIEAPWSNFDLMTSIMVSGIGIYLFNSPDLFEVFGGVYSGMARLGSERTWACIFLFFGIIGLMNVLWCVQPSFIWRLLARMGVALCLLTFTFNHLNCYLPPLSSVTYGLLSIWALWGVVRTKPCGR